MIRYQTSAAQSPIRLRGLCLPRRSSRLLRALGLIVVRVSATAESSNLFQCAELRKATFMDSPLAGRAILIIEDDVLVALDIQQTFEQQGAAITTARTIAAALLAIEDPSLSAAIVDHALGDGDSSVLCQRLKERDVPFITYSGHSNLDGACAGTKHLTKPTSGSLLVSTVKSMLAERQHSN